MEKEIQALLYNNQENQYDIIIVLTVWKRNNLENQLKQVQINLVFIVVN